MDTSSEASEIELEVDPDKKEISETEIEATFEFFDPSEKDRPSLVELLRQQFRDVIDFDVQELASTLIEQAWRHRYSFLL